MKHSLLDQPKYASFIKARDQFLDQINHRNRQEIADVLRGTFSHITYGLESIYRRYEDSQFNYGFLKQMLKAAEEIIDAMLDAQKESLVARVKQDRRQVHDFTYASELAALSRVLNTNPKLKAQKDHGSRDAPSGGSLDARIGFTFDKLKRKLMNAVHQSAIMEEPTKDMLLRVLKQFPESKVLQNPKRSLKPPGAFKEANVKATTDIVDEESWNSMLDKYKNDYVPKYRGPEHIVGGEELAKPPLSEYYAWELEQELTEDFVNQVRLGQVESMKDAGIEDMMWVAIIDDKTDDCCSVRDGLTSKEIEEKMESGEIDDDECDAVVPPGHFNCRCTISPVTEYLPEAPESDVGSFEDWLNE